MRTKDSRAVLRGLECGNALRLPGELDQTLELPFVLTTVECALGESSSGRSAIVIKEAILPVRNIWLLLQAANVQISMDGKGRALDNIFTERLWRTVKYEEVYLHDYLSPREARQALTRYFTFYNQERLHQALEYQTPADVYFHKV